MARINLLPWREWERERRQKDFLTNLGGILVVGLVLVFCGGLMLDRAVEQQTGRNQFLQRHIDDLNRFLRGMVSWTGYKRTLVSYECADRAAGQSKYSAGKMVGLALDAVFSFSAEPLRLALRFGVTMAVLGFIYLFWTVVPGLFSGDLVPGYASLIGVTICFTNIQNTLFTINCDDSFIFKQTIDNYFFYRQTIWSN